MLGEEKGRVLKPDHKESLSKASANKTAPLLKKKKRKKENKSTFFEGLNQKVQCNIQNVWDTTYKKKKKKKKKKLGPFEREKDND